MPSTAITAQVGRVVVVEERVPGVRVGADVVLHPDLGQDPALHEQPPPVIQQHLHMTSTSLNQPLGLRLQDLDVKRLELAGLETDIPALSLRGNALLLPAVSRRTTAPAAV